MRVISLISLTTPSSRQSVPNTYPEDVELVNTPYTLLSTGHQVRSEADVESGISFSDIRVHVSAS